MTAFWLMLGLVGGMPLMVALALGRRGTRVGDGVPGAALRPVPGLGFVPDPGSVLLATLALNLVFFWQELWLVLPKALVPGLHPVLYHNDHVWTGHAPVAELLQGTGAWRRWSWGWPAPGC